MHYALLYGFLLLSLNVVAADINVERNLPEEIQQDEEFAVGLNVVISNISVYAIEENIPQGFQIVDTGSGNVDGNKIKFVNITESGSLDSVTLQYRLASTVDEATYTFEGVYVSEGMNSSSAIRGNESITVTCTEVWECSSWSSCENEIKTRSCDDINNCGTTENKPSESMTCEPPSDSDQESSKDSTSDGPERYVVSCHEDWQCTYWGECTKEGLKHRTCEDINNCDTEKERPRTVKTCEYTGTCSDGLMNGNEEGVDCGGRCLKECEQTITQQTNLVIHADSIEGEILDSYSFDVNITNNGKKLEERYSVYLNKWSNEKKSVSNILPGETRTYRFNFHLPHTVGRENVSIHLATEREVIKTKTVDARITVPDYALKFIREGDLHNPVIVVDNSGKDKRKLDIQYIVVKDGETYLSDEEKNIDAFEDKVSLHAIDSGLNNLPEGRYHVSMDIYENGTKIATKQSAIKIKNDKEALNLAIIFYMLTSLVVGSFVFMVMKIINRGA